MFERSETTMKRPESARQKIPMRENLFSKEYDNSMHKNNDVGNIPVEEAREQEEDG